MPSAPRVPAPLPRQPSALRQWCGTCQRGTFSVIIEGRTFCASCQPKGYDIDCDDEDGEL